MTFKKALVSLALVATSMLVLAGCSVSGTSNSPAGSFTDSATAKPAPATAAAPTLNAGGFLGGNAKPELPDGDGGKISVVSQGALVSNGGGSGELLFAFRNNTSKVVSSVHFTGTATADGKLVASGESQGTIPAQVQPGEAGFAYIYFPDVSSIPATGATYAFKASARAADFSVFSAAPLTVGEVNNNGTSITGSAVNKTGKPLEGPYAVYIYCFNDSTPVSQIIDFAHEDGDVAAGASVSFSTNLYGNSCDTYLVGVSASFK